MSNRREMFPAYSRNSGKSPRRGHERPADKEDDTTLWALQVTSTQRLEKRITNKAQVEEDSVDVQCGYGDFDSDDDDGGVTILEPKKEMQDNSASDDEDGEGFKRPEDHNSRKRKHDSDGISERTPAAQKREQKNASNPNHDGYASFPTGPNRRQNPYTEDFSDVGSNRRRRRSRSGSRSSHDSRSSKRRSRSRDRDSKRRKKSKKSKRSSSGSSTDSNQSRRSSASHRSTSSVSQPRGQAVKYSHLQKSEALGMSNNFIITARKRDHQNIWEIPLSKNERTTARLGTRFILGLESDSRIFDVAYADEVQSTAQQRTRTFYNELGKIENSRDKKAIIETYFHTRVPITDGYWNIIKVMHLHNNLTDIRENDEEVKTGTREVYRESLEKLRMEVKNNEMNVEALLDLIDMEVEMNLMNNQSYTYLSVKELAMKHMSLIKTAIKRNPRNHLLKIVQCEIRYNISEKCDRFENDYRNVVGQFPQEPLVWMKLFDFWQFDSNVHDHEKLKQAFETCFDKAEGLILGTLRTHNNCNTPEFRRFYLSAYIRFLKYFMQRGLTPIALACVQATMEYNFGLSECSDYAYRHEQLETFWNMSLPRIGDVEGHGAAKAMRMKWLEGSNAKFEKDFIDQLFDKTSAAIFAYLGKKDVRLNWVKFNRAMADIDSYVKRTVVTANEIYTDDRDAEYAAISFKEPVSYRPPQKENENTLSKSRTVIPFFSENENTSEFLQPILELMGLKFLHSTGCHTTSEQVISEWISDDILANPALNFEKVPTYTENTCSTVGERILNEVLLKTFENLEFDKSESDEELVKLLLARIELSLSNIEKSFRSFFQLNGSTVKNVIKKIIIDDEFNDKIFTARPFLKHIAAVYIGERLVTWIEKGLNEQRELTRIDEQIETLDPEITSVLKNYMVIERDVKNLTAVKNSTISFLNATETMFDEDERQRQLNDPTLPYTTLQLKLYSLIIRSRLYFFDVETHQKIRIDLAMAIMGDPKEVVEGLEKKDVLWMNLNEAIGELSAAVKAREIPEKTVPQLPKATTLCEALRCAINFVFLEQNRNSRADIDEMMERTLKTLGNFQKSQRDVNRTEKLKYQDRICVQFLTDLLITFFSHNNSQVHKSYQIIYYLNYKALISGATEAFPCHSKYFKLLADLFTNSQYQWIKLCGMMNERIKDVRKKMSRHFDVSYERQLLMFSLTIMYATKKICHKTEGNSKMLLYKTYLEQAKQLRDPTIWRMALKAAAAVSTKEMRERVYMAAMAQCKWALNIHIDYIENEEDPESKILQRMILSFIKLGITLSTPIIYMDDFETLRTHQEITETNENYALDT